MIWARVKDGVVIDCIVLDDVSLSSIFSAGFDYFIRIDNLDPKPGVGWGYDGVNFIQPQG